MVQPLQELLLTIGMKNKLKIQIVWFRFSEMSIAASGLYPLAEKLFCFIFTDFLWRERLFFGVQRTYFEFFILLRGAGCATSASESDYEQSCNQDFHFLS